MPSPSPARRGRPPAALALLAGAATALAVTRSEGRAPQEQVATATATASTATATATATAPPPSFWPPSTRSALVHAQAKVHDRAGGGVRLGTLAIGTRLGWRQVVVSGDRCGAWLELPEGGWVCARELAPSDALPAASPQPPFDPERLSDQGHVRTGEADGAASSFGGVDLAAAPPPRWPFGWVVADDRHPDVVIRAAPSPIGAELARLPARARVPILEVVGDFARIGDGAFIPRDQLRIARRTVRPDGVAADERWLDVDLDEQVLIAYDGDLPRYATMISSGRRETGTPTGTHRITEKHAMITMSSPPGWPILWDVPRVPWSMTYRKNFAVHGAYWHDGYGERRSHGCVNLAPRDARFVYQFTSPPVPDGWVEVRGNGRGSVVRIRDRHHPEPGWLDLDGLPLPPGG